MSARNSALLQSFVGHVMAGEYDRLAELIHPDFQLIHSSTVPYAGTYRGAEGFLRFLNIFTDCYDDLEMETGEIFVAPSGSLIVEIQLRGIVKAMGGRVDTSMLEKWDFSDGKVTRIKPHYFDPNLIA